MKSFKERFQGKTTTLKANEGIHHLMARASNPIVKESPNIHSRSSERPRVNNMQRLELNSKHITRKGRKIYRVGLPFM
jgi:hypothetical protein